MKIREIRGRALDRSVKKRRTPKVLIFSDVRKYFYLKPGKIVFIPCNSSLRLVIVPPTEKAREMLKAMNTENMREEI